jgi:uncharacterized protein YjbI with pentapeptide repeats
MKINRYCKRALFCAFTVTAGLLAVGGSATAASLLAVGGTATAASCPIVDPSTHAVSPAPASGVDWSGCNLSQAIFQDADFTDANLTNANFTNAFLSGSVFTGANISGANFSGAVLNGVASGTGGITAAVPATLPTGFALIDGYLVGPDAALANASLGGDDLAGADLNSANLTGADLAGADLSGADLTRARMQNANLTGANLNGATLTWLNAPGSNFNNADLTNADLEYSEMSGGTFAGAKLINSNLSADLSDATFTKAALTGTNLTNAKLNGADFYDAIITNANLTGAGVYMTTDPGAVWSNDICPDGTNSNMHVDGCLTGMDTLPPVATVTGVRNHGVYVLGAAPKAGCETTDNSVVATPATLTITTTGKSGVGDFTATCSGAVDRAGNKAAPVSKTYLVVYGFGGYLSPVPGKPLSSATKSITVRFHLVRASGSAIAVKAARALAAANGVRVTFAGPGVRSVTAACHWKATAGAFSCSVPVSGHVRTRNASRYTLSATEDVGTGLVLAPHVGKIANPLVIHFR